MIRLLKIEANPHFIRIYIKLIFGGIYLENY